MLFIIFIVVFISTLILNFILFDVLIYRMFTYHPMAWANNGKPPGFFYFPSKHSIFKGGFSKMKLTKSLYFKTPGWINNDETARKALLFYRISGLIYLLNILTLFIFLLIALLLS